MERLLTPKELGEFLGLAKQTIYNKRAAGGDLPPAIVLGRQVRFKASDVMQWLEHRQEQQDKRPGTKAPKGGLA